jgi:sphingoid base N-palmitoyltransferase
MLSIAFYLSLTISQFFDNKHKDFWQTFIHHIATLMLVYISWVCNFHRIGSLILLVHDSAEAVMEAAKAAKYAKLQRTCDILLGVFFITWIVSRLMMFPRLIFECIFRNQQPFFPMMIVIYSMLVLLQVLHIYWTYLITQIVVQSLKKGRADRDVRSDSSEVSEHEEGKDK